MSNPINSNEYFDLGALQSWNFMDWSNGTVNVQALNSYLDSYVQQAKAQGINETTFSFAQVTDIPALLSGDFSKLSSSDALGMLFKNVGGCSIGGESVFQYMVGRLHSDGMQVGLSFGGESAQASDWNFGFSSSYSPAQAGQELASWAQSMGISDIDFDMEGGAQNMVSQNGAGNVAAFFYNLHKSCLSDGIPVTMTVMGDAGTWGITGSSFGALFQQGYNFTQMFDGLNLMLYNGQYYINAGQTPPQSWDLTTWIGQFMQNTGMSAGQCASELHIGFDGAINYADPSSSGGPLPYPSMPPGLTSGQAAAYIYLEITKELRSIYNDPTLTLGQPFFWDDNANYNVTVGPNGQAESQFFSNTGNFEEDFFQYLSSNKSSLYGYLG